MTRWLVASACAVALIGLGILMLMPSAPSDFHMLGGVLIGTAVCGYLGGTVTGFLVLPRRLRSRFIERKGLHRRMTLSWGNEGLTVETENGHVRVPWGDFFKTRENAKFILLYTSRTRYLILPKRFFIEPGQLASFVELLHKRVGIRSDSQSTDSAEKVG
jgi:hypothetical protein